MEELLTNPLEGLTQKDPKERVQKKFEGIARQLFENYCILCDEKKFRLAEIEFYFYKKGEWAANWNKETYARNKRAGKLFFHYSGCDICFESSYENEEKAEFGGILIRSIIDDNKIIAGPLICKDLFLNTCTNNIPKLHHDEHKNYVLYDPIKRCNIASDKEENMKLDLCYYAKSIDEQELNWETTSERKVWDKKNEKIKLNSRNYKRERGL